MSADRRRKPTSWAMSSSAKRGYCNPMVADMLAIAGVCFHIVAAQAAADL
jgi:hypothetical protein